MRNLCGAVLLLGLCALTTLAAGPNEEYVWVYSLIQQGQALEETDRNTQALAAYLDAQKALERIQRSNPDWSPKVVGFRLRFLQAKIAALEASNPASVAVEPSSASSEDAASNGTEVQALNAEVLELRENLQRLQADNGRLQAKLKEALSVRPASSDPRQLEIAAGQNRALTKQVQLLQAQLAEAESRAPAGSDNPTLLAVRQALADQTRRADRLKDERNALASQVAALTRTAEAGEALREENTLLKKQLAELSAAPATDGGAAAERQLDRALTELASLRSEADVLRLEKTALEQRMQALRDQPENLDAAGAAELARSRERVAELERDRQQLQLQLAQANQDLANLNMAAVGEPNGLAQAEVERLRARLAVYEAEKIPYSAGELALFRMSRGLDASNASRPRPPAGLGPLVAQAQRQFRQGDFQEAEATLNEMLKADKSNAFTLANLAATQMEQGRDAEAEVHLREALASAPRDPFTLGTMGILKFRQQQYDDALDYLGLAAQYNPDSPAIFNYLGMTLSEQGMRGPAETALRRAIQLQPGFADAHFNLALVYILQDPPVPELARWHYQKALQAGHERSTRMEQMLDQVPPG